MVDPYVHPQHMYVLKHLPHVWSGCESPFIWVWGHNQCTMTSFVTQLAATQEFHQLPKLSTNKNGESGMMVDPSSHPQHMNVLKHVYICGLDVGAHSCGSEVATYAPWHHL